MATYRFSALYDGQSVGFRPGIDVLSFDQSSISAADVRISAYGSGTRVQVVSGAYAGKDIVLLNTAPAQLTTAGVSFVNGSRLLVGDNTTGTGSDNSANSLTGTSGRDHFYGFGGNDTMYGMAGNDVFDMSSGTASSYGNDRIDGGSGADTIDFTSARSAVTVNLAAGSASGGGTATLISIENVLGGAYNDVLIGSAGSNYLSGGAGNDRLETGGSDFAPSTIVTDTLAGGTGNDTYVLHRNVGTYSHARVAISDSGGVDTVVAHSGVWTLGAGLENLTLGFDWTSEGEARGIGNSSNNVITGYQGWWVSNRLEGRGGNDSLRGGDGNDWLEGGTGTDTLTGGAGADSFVFRNFGADRITDFNAAADELMFDNAVFGALGTEGAWSTGDGRFRAAAGATSGADANDRIIYNTSSGNLYYDPDGSGGSASQLIATLPNLPGLTADDISVI